MNSRVWINGASVGTRTYCYLSFEYDITQSVTLSASVLDTNRTTTTTGHSSPVNISANGETTISKNILMGSGRPVEVCAYSNCDSVVRFANGRSLGIGTQRLRTGLIRNLQTWLYPHGKSDGIHSLCSADHSVYPDRQIQSN